MFFEPNSMEITLNFTEDGKSMKTFVFPVAEELLGNTVYFFIWLMEGWLIYGHAPQSDKIDRGW